MFKQSHTPSLPTSTSSTMPLPSLSMPSQISGLPAIPPAPGLASPMLMPRSEPPTPVDTSPPPPAPPPPLIAPPEPLPELPLLWPAGLLLMLSVDVDEQPNAPRPAHKP